MNRAQYNKLKQKLIHQCDETIFQATQRRDEHLQALEIVWNLSKKTEVNDKGENNTKIIRKRIKGTLTFAIHSCLPFLPPIFSVKDMARIIEEKELYQKPKLTSISGYVGRYLVPENVLELLPTKLPGDVKKGNRYYLYRLVEKSTEIKNETNAQ